MSEDITYCTRGYNQECPKYNECKRANPYYLDSNSYTWFFDGCDLDENGNPDYSLLL